MDTSFVQPGLHGGRPPPCKPAYCGRLCGEGREALGIGPVTSVGAPPRGTGRSCVSRSPVSFSEPLDVPLREP